MFSRPHLKFEAKEFLKKYYLQAFLVCLVTTLFMGGGSGSGNGNHNQHIDITFEENTMMHDMTEQIPFDINGQVVQFATRRFQSPLFVWSTGTIFVTLILFILLSVTIGYAVEVGQSRFFLDGFHGNAEMGRVFSTFHSSEYIPVVKTQFLRSFYIFLWSLLFIIPGIIKSYEYRFVPYILAEDPTVESNEALFRSREMTQGYKMEIFILDLSFIGWYILGGLFFGIGTFLVDPYREATNARLYMTLSENEQGYGQGEAEYGSRKNEFGDW